MAENKNLELWNSVCETNPEHTKNVSFGRKFTAIGAQHQRKAATAKFGKYGEKWGIKELKYELIRDENSKPLLWTIDGLFFYPDGQFPISSEMTVFTNKGKVEEDARKKLLTDITTKALSFLGFNSDIFEGKYDKPEYVKEMKDKHEEKPPLEELTKKHEKWNGIIKALEKGTCDVSYVEERFSMSEEIKKELTKTFEDARKAVIQD